MMVHIYGLPVDVDPVLDLAAKYNLYLIEDAAEAHGLAYKDRPCGSFGDISTFSFYPNKLISTGEGGMLVTNDQGIADRCRSLRNLCFQADRRFVHEELGWNLRMSNIQAALGVAQLERFEEFYSKKRYIGERYSELLADISGIQLPLSDTAFAQNAYWIFGIVLQDEIPFDAAKAIQRLAKEGLGCRPFFWPMHEQPVFANMGLFDNKNYPVAERIARRGFYIPSGLAITDKQLNRVAAALGKVLS
jgi:perosamine synthetase